jgi:tetratricopeptide (TPR) repeat protein
LEEQLSIRELLGASGMSNSLVDLGALYFRLGDYKRARDYLEKSLSLSLRSGEKLLSNWARVTLGYVLLRMGEMVQARTILGESQQQFREVGSIIGVVFATEGLANLMIGQGQFQEATRLLGWADATGTEIQDTRPSNEQVDVDRDIATLIERIGEEAFAAAYAAGKGMTMEEAMALAMGVCGEETAV